MRSTDLPEDERRLAAIMFTDMVGYTAMAQRDERLAMGLLAEHNKLLRPFFPRFSGREVKTIGDSFLAEFASALDAVRCAVGIQEFLHQRNSSLGSGRSFEVRIGVHVGDVIYSNGDILGDAVNISSRIEPLAEPGGICISQQVYDQVRNKVELHFVKLEGASLKNVSLPIEVYRMTMPWSVSGQRPEAPLDPHRIAVMPLVNMISDPKDEYFADGMTEELISAFSKVRGLSVISRTSVMRYKNQSKSASEVGRELKCGTLLEGSVRKAGNRVRIAVQLINAENDEHVWAENYDRTLEDVFSIQSDIAQSVASALKVTLLESDRERLEQIPTKDPEAHALYLKGRARQLRITPDDLNEAAKLYQKAIDKDHEYALAYAWLSACTSQMGYHEITPPIESFKKGEELARRSLALDPSLPEAHLALADALYMQWDFKGAEVELDRAYELDPKSPLVLDFKSDLMRERRRFDEAAGLARRELELDPLSPSTLNSVATALLYSRQPDEAIALYRKVLEIDPDAAFARGNIGVAYVEKGMLDEGIASIREAIRMERSYQMGAVCDLAHALGKAGRTDELKGLLPEAKRWYEKNHHGAMALVAIYANLGEKDEAFEWLEKAFEEHSGYLMSAFVDFAFESLHSDPRMEAMKRRLGL
jgi:TolB-like protein/Flp pilus assembly protein TadD